MRKTEVVEGEKKMNTLEQDLMECFEKRNIEVIKLEVTDGATNYLIKVKRVIIE